MHPKHVRRFSRSSKQIYRSSSLVPSPVPLTSISGESPPPPPPPPTSKMSGGICAVLDYEIEWMAEYVAEMATRLVLGNHAVAPVTFRQFAAQILAPTRLPSATILLGMNYFAKRISQMRMAAPRLDMTEGQARRMLTIALLLGSKFL